MFVSGLDRSWIHTPWFRHKFLITKPAELEALHKCGIRMVTIDVDQGLDIDDREDQPLTENSVSQDSRSPDPPLSSQENPMGEPTDSPIHVLGDNLSLARRQLDKWSQVLQPMFDTITTGGYVQVEDVKPQVEQMITDFVGPQQAACLAVLRSRRGHPSLYEHALSVFTLSLVLAQAKGYAAQRILHVGLGAILHDVGLLRLPKNVIKNRRTLTAIQRALYDSHPEHGVKMVQTDGTAELEIQDIVRGHHQALHADERNNPPEAISEACRLVALADAYDDLIMGDGDLPPLASNQAVSHLFRAHQHHQDLSALVALMIRVIGVYPLYSVVQLTTKEIGIVAVITPGKAHQPILCMVKDASGRSMTPPTLVDLASGSHPPLAIESICAEEESGIDVEAALKIVGV